MENTDENHCLSTTDILDYLEQDMGIKAERRSLYTDIDEINKLIYFESNPPAIDDKFKEELQELKISSN